MRIRDIDGIFDPVVRSAALDHLSVADTEPVGILPLGSDHAPSCSSESGAQMR